jgi:hypothetical protein
LLHGVFWVHTPTPADEEEGWNAGGGAKS